MFCLQSHNKKDLINICPGDQEKWPLVFYMSSDGDNIRRFESALYKGWFIYTQKVDSNVVGMQEDQFDSIQCAFSIIIMSEKGSC